VGFLEIAAANFAGGNMSGNRQYRNVIAVAIEQAVD
jgi:hypothetical protein